MTIQEWLNEINTYCSNSNICDIYELLDENIIKLQYLSTVDHDEHRWYVLDLNVYKTWFGNKEYYIGVWEVGILKSEMMNVSDCDHVLNFFEMEPYTTISYRVKH